MLDRANRPGPPAGVPVMSAGDVVRYSQERAAERGDSKAIFKPQDVWADIKANRFVVGVDAFWEVVERHPTGGYWVITRAAVNRRIEERLQGPGRRQRVERIAASPAESPDAPQITAEESSHLAPPSPEPAPPAREHDKLDGDGCAQEGEGTPYPLPLHPEALAQVMPVITRIFPPGSFHGEVPDIIRRLYQRDGLPGVLRAILGGILVSPHLWPTLYWLAAEKALPDDISDALITLSRAAPAELSEACRIESEIGADWARSTVAWGESSPRAADRWHRYGSLATAVRTVREGLTVLLANQVQEKMLHRTRRD